MHGVPGQSEETVPAVGAVLAESANARKTAVVVASGYGPFSEGKILGLVTATLKWRPMPKSRVTTAVADPTLVTTVVVEDASGFVVGDVVDIVNGSDGSSVIYNDKTLSGVNYETNTLTFSAALGASTAIDTADFVKKATDDGSLTSLAIALQPSLARTGAAATETISEDRVIEAVKSGVVDEAAVIDISTVGVLTALGGTSEGNGHARVGF